MELKKTYNILSKLCILIVIKELNTKKFIYTNNLVWIKTNASIMAMKRNKVHVFVLFLLCCENKISDKRSLKTNLIFLSSKLNLTYHIYSQEKQKKLLICYNLQLIVNFRYQ